MLGALETREDTPLSVIGRYALFDEVAHGGMATVHIGRLVGAAGFSKTVAIKKMHESVARKPEVVAMFLDEARLASRIQHPNVVLVFDVLAADDEVFLIMEYVHGDTLAGLQRMARSKGERVDPAIAVHVLRGALYGLHAAHESCDEQGQPLLLVHRDVSPQNIMVGVDGTAKVLDFGIAKAVGRLQDTRSGQVKGKVAYMAPEQLLGRPIDCRVDVFAAGVVLWEILAGRRLFAADSSGEVMYRVLETAVPLLSDEVDNLPPALVAAVARATSKDPNERFATALEFAQELERTMPILPARVVGDWVRQHGGDELRLRGERLRAIEALSVNVQRVSKPPTLERVLDERWLPAGPDDVTRSELATSFHERMQQRRPKPVLRAALVSAALLAAAASVAWTLWPHPADHYQPDAPAPTVAAAPAPVGTSTSSVAAAAPSLLEQPSTAPSAAAVSAPTRARPTTRSRPVAQPKRRQEKRPEDLFSRE